MYYYIKELQQDSYSRYENKHNLKQTESGHIYQ